jgi:hypothetical protein
LFISWFGWCGGCCTDTSFAHRIAMKPTQLTLLIVLCVLLVILVQLIAFWLLG